MKRVIIAEASIVVASLFFLYCSPSNEPITNTNQKKHAATSNVVEKNLPAPEKSSASDVPVTTPPITLPSTASSKESEAFLNELGVAYSELSGEESAHLLRLAAVSTFFLCGTITNFNTTMSMLDGMQYPLTNATLLPSQQALSREKSAISSVTFQRWGGEMGGKYFMTSGMPRLNVGDNYCIFLKRASDGYLWPATDGSFLRIANGKVGLGRTRASPAILTNALAKHFPKKGITLKRGGL